MNEEVHIKIGGDHGGGSFKMSYQLCNQKNPNSQSNTVVFNVFEAKDNKLNLKTALSQYKNSITDIQKTSWRYA